MRPSSRLAFLGAAACSLIAQDAFFESKIRPVLAERCYSCHSAQAKTPFAGLRLDSREGFLRGGDRGPAIIPGNAAESLMIKAVRHRVVQMPPGAKLPDDQIEALERWVQMGAPWPAGTVAAPVESKTQSPVKAHWSWQPLERSGANIDALIAARLRKESLTMSPPADRRTLLRRLSYDLIGLPPTYNDVSNFERDSSPAAYEGQVDRLLASPHFGERWARHWLDLARYSDSGFNNIRFPYAFTYRDWVIRAFNDDMPYSQFVLRQLAADLLPQGENRQHLPALGFLSLGHNPPRDSLIPEKIDDRIDVVSRTFLGLTVSCARCHDHKYDPIPTRDYYSLYGVFLNSYETESPAAVDSESSPLDTYYRPLLDKRLLTLQAYKQRRTEEIRAEMRQPAQLKRFIMAGWEARGMTNPQAENLAKERNLNLFVFKRWRGFLKTSLGRRFLDDAGNNGEPAAETWSQRLHEADRDEPHADPGKEVLRLVLRGADGPPHIPVEDFGEVLTEGDNNTVNNLRWHWDGMYSDYAMRGSAAKAMGVADRAQSKPAYVFVRGNMNDLGEPAPRRFLSLLGGAAFSQGSGRLELGTAIIDPGNPLTSRVIVNRVWQHLFGEGLVRTPSDFGIRGEAPSHPELLDALATGFIADGWSVKRLIRRIVLSKAYQQASADDEASRIKDPENRLLWRANRRRLDFDAARDTLLAVSGQLNTSIGGPSFALYAEPTDPRRTMYAFAERERAQMLLKSFDYADPEQHTPQRHMTTVAQQALFFLNSNFVGEQARHVAWLGGTTSAPYDGPEIQRLHRRVFGRNATEREAAAGLAFLRGRAATPPVEADRVTVWEYGWGELDPDAGKIRSFEPFRYFSNNMWQGASLLPAKDSGNAALRDTGGTPGDDLKHAVIRRWISPMEATVSIDGTLSQAFNLYDQRFGLTNGIRGWVVSSRKGILGSWTIDPPVVEKFTDNVPVRKETKFSAIQVAPGETIDFIVDSRGDYERDSFTWSPVIRDDKGNEWDSRKAFRGPEPRRLTAWEEYTQVLLLTNELMFVD